MKIRFPFLFLTLAAISSPPAHAHEMRPGYLEIRETAKDTYDVTWKVPARGWPHFEPITVDYRDDEATRLREAGLLNGPFPLRMQLRASATASVTDPLACPDTHPACCVGDLDLDGVVGMSDVSDAADPQAGSQRAF